MSYGWKLYGLWWALKIKGKGTHCSTFDFFPSLVFPPFFSLGHLSNVFISFYLFWFICYLQMKLSHCHQYIFCAGPTLIGILPYAGLKFYIYEELKTRVPEEHQKSVVLRLSCGALAGLFGQTLTYPLDVVRRQMQVF